MSGMIMFCLGVILGLVFGPAKERIDAAHIDGWVAGYKAAKRERHPHA